MGVSSYTRTGAEIEKLGDVGKTGMGRVNMTRSRNHYITTYKSISGWKAVERAEYEDSPGQWFEDNEQTGFGAYATREEAIQEAKDWSESDAIPYRD